MALPAPRYPLIRTKLRARIRGGYSNKKGAAANASTDKHINGSWLGDGAFSKALMSHLSQVFTSAEQRPLVADSVPDGEVAKVVGVSRRTVIRWQQYPEFSAKTGVTSIGPVFAAVTALNQVWEGIHRLRNVTFCHLFSRGMKQAREPPGCWLKVFRTLK
jgi:hypothetical protein